MAAQNLSTYVGPQQELGQYFLSAVYRLGRWEQAILSRLSLNQLETQPAFPSRFFQMERDLLLDLLNSGARISNAESLLVNLNSTLLANEEIPLFDSGALLRNLYQLMEKNQPALIACLALFDAHIPEDGINLNRAGSYSSELIPIVFNVITKGLNIWSLHRRWQDYYFQNTRVEEFARFTENYYLHERERENIGNDLINRFNSQFDPNKFSIQIYKRSLASLFRSSLDPEDSVKAIYFRIICASEDDCYGVSAWVSRLGNYQYGWARNSLFFPETNGARRLQICVQQTEDKRYIIARLGTEETFFLNEWGRLLDVCGNQEAKLTSRHMNTDTSVITSRMIFVYSIYGEKQELAGGSTVADFILCRFNETEALFVKTVFVNGEQVSITHELNDSDVVYVLFDRSQREMFLHDIGFGDHKYLKTRKIVDELRQKEITATELGKTRLVFMLQKFLDPWNIRFKEEDFILLLTLAGYRTTKTHRELVFANLAKDHSRDNYLCRLALQYYLRGRVRRSDGEAINLPWKNIKFHSDCQPKFGDPIVGTDVLEPRNPNNPRYGFIVVHHKDCKERPAERNSISLVWSPEYQETKIAYGIQGTLSLVDGKGTLGEFMELIYDNTTLETHFVHADAMNYGKNRAQVTLVATASTEEEIDQASEVLRKVDPSARIKRLSSRDAREILASQRQNPYLLFGDPEIEKDSPPLFIGRTRETNYLKQMINDPRTNTAIVVGYYRMGKTWFLKNFKSSYQLPNHLHIHISFENPPEKKLSPDSIPYDIYLAIIGKMEELKIPRMSSIISQRPKSLDGLSKWLKQISERADLKLTLLLDEFSGINVWVKERRLDQRFPERFIRFINETRFVNFVLVFQAAQVYSRDLEDSQFIDLYKSYLSEGTIEILPFTNSELEEHLTSPVMDYYRILPEGLDLAYTLTGGIPFLSAKIGKTIWEFNRADNKRELSRAELVDILGQSFSDDPDWDAFLSRMSNKLDPMYKSMLTSIAKRQLIDNRWQSESFYWVPERELFEDVRNLFNDKREFDDSVTKLCSSRIVISRARGSQNEYQIRPILLAMKLLGNRFGS